MDPVAPPENSPSETEEVSEESFKAESLLDKIRSKIPDTSHFAQTILIPILVVVFVLLVGAGGTYIVASNVFNPDTKAPVVSRISEEDLAEADVALPSPTAVALRAIPTPNPTATPAATLTPTPTVNAAQGWTAYSFGALNLGFSYPPDWFITVPPTSGAPYLYVHSVIGSLPNNYSPGQFAIRISRLEQVGITTMDALTTQLAVNAASSTTLNGANLGQVSVLSSVPLTINGYQALQRTVTYSASPSAQMTEVYILDGVSNVVQLIPFLDITFGNSYFNTVLQTIQFTN